MKTEVGCDKKIGEDDAKKIRPYPASYADQKNRQLFLAARLSDQRVTRSGAMPFPVPSINPRSQNPSLKWTAEERAYKKMVAEYPIKARCFLL
jgi:hypothetical protein